MHTNPTLTTVAKRCRRTLSPNDTPLPRAADNASPTTNTHTHQTRRSRERTRDIWIDLFIIITALQQRILDDDADPTTEYQNYVCGPWFDMYLQDRRPLVLNSNPSVGWKADPTKPSQLQRATSLLTSAAAFHRTLRDGHLEPDIFHTEPKKSQSGWWEKVIPLVPRKFSFYGAYAVGAYPLDMSQYDLLFQSTRIPRLECDELQPFVGSTHVCVQRGARFFALDVLATDGTALPDVVVAAGLKQILEVEVDASAGDLDYSNPDAPPLGALTTLDRDSWAVAREHLMQHPTNAETLKTIDSALFVLCLEHDQPTTKEDVQRCYIHGDARNRWFDKSFSIIVLPDGNATINFEHAWGDGVAVIRFFNEVYQESTGSPAVDPADITASAAGVKALDWHVDARAKEYVAQATERVDAFIDSIDIAVVETDVIDSNWVKSKKVSPDGFLQMSFQLAHARTHEGRAGATYESASTSAYKHGRTETIRSTTSLSQAMCDVFLDPDASRADKEAALRAAAENHNKITRDALMGKGWDRHMFALRTMAEAEARAGGEDVPSLFTCDAYQKLNNIILSTSTLASPGLEAGGFGPVNKDCYAIPYSLTKEQARFGVMSYKLGTEAFASAIVDSIQDFKDVLEGGE